MRHLPNAITFSRLACIPALVAAAASGRARLWIVLLVYALLSDVADGILARRLGAASAFGTRFDSIADCALYLTAPLSVPVLFPWIRERFGLTLVMVFAAYALPVLYGFAKYRRLTSYHTVLARAAAVSLGTTFFILLATEIGWPFRLATAVLVVSAIEEIAITSALSEWRANVPSLSHALRGALPSPADALPSPAPRGRDA